MNKESIKKGFNQGFGQNRKKVGKVLGRMGRRQEKFWVESQEGNREFGQNPRKVKIKESIKKGFNREFGYNGQEVGEGLGRITGRCQKVWVEWVGGRRRFGQNRKKVKI